MVPVEFVVPFLASVAGGAINAVAGGGTLLTFPSLLWAGQTAIAANATSTVALWPGALSSFWNYRAELGSNRREFFFLALPSLLGGTLGAVLLVNTRAETFSAIVPYLILAATLLFLAQGPLSRLHGPAGEGSTPRRYAVVAFQFLVGVYGGYFGAGIGILMLAAFGFLGMTNIHHMNALKNLNGMCINGIAAALFIARGMVDWRFAAIMAAGAIFGGYAGAGAARKIGQKNVRRLVVAIGFALTAWLLFLRTE